MTLTPKQLKDVCLLGHSDKSRTCRYLSPDDLQEGKWYCHKLRPVEKAKIDKSIEKIQNRNTPVGDNCPGYPVMKHISQGYDVV